MARENRPRLSAIERYLSPEDANRLIAGRNAEFVVFPEEKVSSSYAPAGRDWYEYQRTEGLAVPTEGPSGTMYHAIYGRQTIEKVEDAGLSFLGLGGETTLLSRQENAANTMWQLRGFMTMGVTREDYLAGAEHRSAKTNASMLLWDKQLLAKQQLHLAQEEFMLHLVPGGGTANILGGGGSGALSNTVTVLSDLTFFASLASTPLKMSSSAIRAIRAADVAVDGFAIGVAAYNASNGDKAAIAQLMLRSASFTSSVNSLNLGGQRYKHIAGQSVGAASIADDFTFSRARKYELNPKHGMESRFNSKGQYVGARPTNPEEALANSIPMKGTDRTRRIAYDETTKQIIIFDRHGDWLDDGMNYGGLWHGHVRPWEKLDDVHKQTLTKARMFDSKGRYVGDK